jgi:RNA recognition motif-containing protein
VGRKIYVGNLSYSVGDDALRRIFAAYGKVVSAQVITDRESGRSKGFGFVEMADEEAAQSAIAGLNGRNVEGRNLTVSEARSQGTRGAGGVDPGRRGGRRF